MAASQNNLVVEQLRRAVLLPDGADFPDAQLLRFFVEQRDETAFEALVRRHGPMVLGVCRRVLRNMQDVEDAFQATFLVLAHKAAAIKRRELLANWLYGVAHNTARKARAIRTKRQAREKQVTAMPEAESVERESVWQELEPLLDQELSRLPEKYRIPLILCELAGKTREEVAQQLNLLAGTLSSRLARAKNMLAKRLSRHRLVVSSGSLTAVLSQNATSASVPTSLVAATTKGASLFASGQVVLPGMISATVVSLTEGVIKATLMTKLKLGMLVGLTVGCLCASAVVSTQILVANAKSVEQEEHSQEALAPFFPPRDGGDKLEPQDPNNPDPANPDPAKNQPAKDSKVKVLLKERLDLLRQIADMLQKQAQQGTVSWDQIMRAEQRALKAEFDLCETDKERLALQEKILETWKTIEKRAAEIQRSGVIPPSVLLEAKVNRLEAEIELERMKAKVESSSK